MQEPIGILKAAYLAKTTRIKIHRAMEADRLMWTSLGGHQVTTKAWVRQWQAEGGK